MVKHGSSPKLKKFSTTCRRLEENSEPWSDVVAILVDKCAVESRCPVHASALPAIRVHTAQGGSSMRADTLENRFDLGVPRADERGGAEQLR